MVVKEEIIDGKKDVFGKKFSKVKVGFNWVKMVVFIGVNWMKNFVYRKKKDVIFL